MKLEKFIEDLKSLKGELACSDITTNLFATIDEQISDLINSLDLAEQQITADKYIQENQTLINDYMRNS